MALILRIDFRAPHGYVARYIRATADEMDVPVSVVQSKESITVVADEHNEKSADFLRRLAQTLPASIHMDGAEHRLARADLPAVREQEIDLPLSIGLCPRCHRELFNPDSRRYYYPFTMCRCCGPQWGLSEGYPFVREHSLLRFFTPCEACRIETTTNPFRRDFPLVSCHDCGIPVRMGDGRRERYANDAGSFKKLFESAAAAVANGKKLHVKTLTGWRSIFLAKEKVSSNAVMMVTDGSALQDVCVLLEVERNALLSIERPAMTVALQKEAADVFGPAATVFCPDEGFSLLLAAELAALGVRYVACEFCDGAEGADVIVDYDLQIEAQVPMRLFVNKSVRFVLEGERGVFPLYLPGRNGRAAVSGSMAAVPWKEGTVIDAMTRFESAEASSLWVPENEEIDLNHSRTRRFDPDAAAVMSVLVENDLIGSKAVACRFEKAPVFYYYDGQKAIRAVPPEDFEADALKERIASLREGSDRLAARFEERFAEDAATLFERSGDLFEAIAAVLGIGPGDMDSVAKEALRFTAKGGVQVDTRLQDGRFNPYAFLASLMSYRLAGAQTPLLAYSVFESLGDFISDTLTLLKRRAHADHIAICGRAFGVPTLFSRFQKQLGAASFVTNRAIPIDERNVLIGALAL